jgi:hypothetical protein
VDFIPLIIEGYNMNTMVADVEEKQWTLSPLDRCDRCNAEALVQVTGLSGDLMFCGHHYNKIMDNSVGYKKMMEFAITVVDERSKLE